MYVGVYRNMQTILDYEGEDMKSVFGLTFEVCLFLDASNNFIR